MGLTTASIPGAHCMLAWGSSCLHGATSTVELQLANAYTHTHTHIRPNRSANITFAQQRSVSPLVFTTSWSSGAQSSLSSLCSALAHVVFFMSNLILNLKPATTYRETRGGESVFTAWNSSLTPILLPVWWRRRHCWGQTGEWSQTWSCTWWWTQTEDSSGPLSLHQSPPRSPDREPSLESPDLLWVLKRPKWITDSYECKHSENYFHLTIEFEAEPKKKKLQNRENTETVYCSLSVSWPDKQIKV